MVETRDYILGGFYGGLIALPFAGIWLLGSWVIAVFVLAFGVYGGVCMFSHIIANARFDKVS